MSIPKNVRSGLRLLLTGQWPMLLWMANLHRRRVDVGFMSREQLGYSESPFGHHSITPGPELRRVLKQLDIKESDSVVDIGCGKGSALFTLAEFPFGRVAGCDYSNELVEVAVKNLKRLELTRVDVFQCDATEYDGYDEFNYLFLFNPFSAEVFEKLMVPIQESLQRSPRKLTVIYRNPRSAHVVEQAGLFTRVREFGHGVFPIYIYEHHPDG